MRYNALKKESFEDWERYLRVKNAATSAINKNSAHYNIQEFDFM